MRRARRRNNAKQVDRREVTAVGRQIPFAARKGKLAAEGDRRPMAVDRLYFAPRILQSRDEDGSQWREEGGELLFQAHRQHGEYGDGVVLRRREAGGGHRWGSPGPAARRKGRTLARDRARESRMTVGRKILLVDDDAALRHSLAEQLRLHEEFLPEEAEDGAKALALVGQHYFDAILLDVGLPDMDGRELCRLMRRSGVRSPILMLTGADTDSDAILGLDSGANDYITKPFRLSVLLARLRA